MVYAEFRGGEMEARELKKFETKLKKMHRILSREKKELDDEISEEVSLDREDVLKLKEEIEVFEKEDQLEEGLISEVEEALNRIHLGNYGQCLSCGSQLPGERLEAVPYAKFCVKCQENTEEVSGKS
jgi:DnaK suppressor protein